MPRRAQGSRAGFCDSHEASRAIWKPDSWIGTKFQTLFASLPSSGWAAARDRTLLLFLYNTGARVQEAADLCVKNLELESTLLVHLHGKGVINGGTCPL